MVIFTVADLSFRVGNLYKVNANFEARHVAFGGVLSSKVPPADERETRSKKERGCQREDCFACKSNGNGDCSKNEIVYEIRCNTCDDVCIGKTFQNAYTRGKEHLT